MEQKKPTAATPVASSAAPAHTESHVQQLLHGADYSDVLANIAHEIASGFNALYAETEKLNKTLAELAKTLATFKPESTATSSQRIAEGFSQLSNTLTQSLKALEQSLKQQQSAQATQQHVAARQSRIDDAPDTPKF